MLCECEYSHFTLFFCLSSPSILILVTTTWLRQKWRTNSCYQPQQRRLKSQGGTSRHHRTCLKEKLQLWPASWQVDGFMFCYHSNSHCISTCCLIFFVDFSPSYVLSKNKLCTKPNSWGGGKKQTLNWQWLEYKKVVAENVSQDLKKRLNSIDLWTWYHTP